ncbi:KpsF/GutQ family sugar-phosphate isomerase [Rhizobiaceae bacterium]|nr:KpsF/GutQ family sugar-phosphate isomerase [Rhizobiaceae bacterium]
MTDPASRPAPNPAAASALRTLEFERHGLDAVTAALNADLAGHFAEAVATVRRIAGRVIVTGMGKSGHIAAKIAATFASTGTPAFFVHPSEANHGDLGMIARDDAMLAISWSGETRELEGILGYCRRFAIPLIAITSNADSTLGRNADVVLALPREMEACPHNLAPTTSSIMQLALGDALAVALLEDRGFTAGDFQVFHPGGSLGAQLKRVSDIMHVSDDIPLVSSGAQMSEAILAISGKGFGCTGVVDEHGTLVGIITDGDLARNLTADLMSRSVDDVMTRNPQTVRADQLAMEALKILDMRSISALLVTDGDKPVGIVHFHDLLRLGAT